MLTKSKAFPFMGVFRPSAGLLRFDRHTKTRIVLIIDSSFYKISQSYTIFCGAYNKFTRRLHQDKITVKFTVKILKSHSIFQNK